MEGGEGVQQIRGELIWALWQRVREQGPLVQCVTNFVSMDFMANALLAVGASPAMAHSQGEMEQFSNIASALLVNVGSLTDDWVGSMKLGARCYTARGKPWVLDPVGCGATAYRTQRCCDVFALQPAVVRGNASEVMALGGAAGAATKGVDSTATSDEALSTALQLSRASGSVIAVSGATDLVTDGDSVWSVDNGVEMLTLITAAGCSVTAIVAAFVAANRGHAPAGLAAAAALSVFGLASEVAARSAHGPGSLRVGLLDQLHGLGREGVVAGARVTRRDAPPPPCT